MSDNLIVGLIMFITLLFVVGYTYNNNRLKYKSNIVYSYENARGVYTLVHRHKYETYSDFEELKNYMIDGFSERKEFSRLKGNLIIENILTFKNK